MRVMGEFLVSFLIKFSNVHNFLLQQIIEYVSTQ